MPDTVEPLPAALVDYLACRDAARAARVRAQLAALTPREETLVREAASMGFVQGQRHHKAATPGDSAIGLGDTGGGPSDV